MINLFFGNNFFSNFLFYGLTAVGFIVQILHSLGFIS